MEELGFCAQHISAKTFMEVSEVAKTVEVPQMWLQMSPFRLFGTTVGYSKLWYSPKQAHLLPCLRVVSLLVAHGQVASGLAEGEDFLQPDSWSLLGHVAPACLFLLNLFVLLIVSETEPLPGPAGFRVTLNVTMPLAAVPIMRFYSELLYFRDSGVECRAW